MQWGLYRDQASSLRASDHGNSTEIAVGEAKQQHQKDRNDVKVLVGVEVVLHLSSTNKHTQYIHNVHTQYIHNVIIIHTHTLL